MAGSATFTTDTSRMTMNCARHARISVARGCRGAWSGFPSESRVSLRCVVMSFPWYDDYRTIAKFDKRQTMSTLASKDDPGAPEGTTQAELRHPAPHEIELPAVLHALSDPVRLLIVKTIADGREWTCNSVELPVSKSTCTHHFRVLREAGGIHQRADGTTKLNSLRRDELEDRSPGPLDAVLRATPVS